MFELDFTKPSRVFFCGIGGISMSGLAEILKGRGFTVSGSDRQKSELTDHLEQTGIRVFIGQKAENVTDDIDVFVYTAAIKNGHPELEKARQLNLPMLTRAELLGRIMKNYKIPVAISGTHGKTTVTGMISQILLANESDPTVTIGGMLRTIGGNIRIGGPEYFVTEACEYTNSFLNFFPKISVILNIEEDHMDFFKDIDDIRSSFRRFASLTPPDGAVIIGNDIPGKDKVIEGLSCRVVTFGSDSHADYYPEDIKTDENGNTSFTCKGDAFSLLIPGIHNVLNAVAAIAACDKMGIPRESIRKGLAEYPGTDRRFEYRGTLNGVRIVDDYAHHPSEIRATLLAAKSQPHKKLWVIFQPHTYSRTKAFLPEFAEALSLADSVILTDIYAARETDNLGISPRDIVSGLQKLHTESRYIGPFQEIEEFVKKNCAQGDLLITMGAGDVVTIADELLAK